MKFKTLCHDAKRRKSQKIYVANIVSLNEHKLFISILITMSKLNHVKV